MCRLLLVDDDHAFRTMLVKLLTRGGHEVRDVEDGRAALRAQREDAADLVITDLVMPDMEGLETIQQLRREHPGIKIIAISGGGRSQPGDYLELAARLGAHSTLAKPFSGQQILAAIDEVLAR
jgi:CheY-like chemotaxis protein